MPRFFQITEEDLGELERTLPHIADVLAKPELNNRQRVWIRRVQKIISDVRWNYGPPGEVKVIPGHDHGA